MAEKERKKMKKWKIAVISVIAVILVLSAASAAAYQFYIKPKYADKLIETADKVLQSKEVQELLESEEVQKFLEDEGTKQLLDNINAMSGNEEINKIIQGGSGNTPENKSPDTDENNKPDEKINADNNGDQTSTIVVGGAQKGSSQTNGTSLPENNADNTTQINGTSSDAENKPENTPQTDGTPSDAKNKQENTLKDTSSISAKDMVDGMKIASKIDMDKVSGLTSGNATAEEKSASIKYIKDTLTNEEIAKAIELMAKYKETLK